MTDIECLCLTYRFYSQANFNHCIQKFSSAEFEFTFVDLRYYLEDYHPS